VDERTRQHLVTAEENRAFARTLFADRGSQPVALRWGIVVAFYAAMHYVNAYLWERLRSEPANHRERESFVVTVAILRPVANDYLRLFAASYLSRYAPRYRVPSERERANLLANLDAVRVAVLNALQPTDTES
jgi:hypothetical protein